MDIGSEADKRLSSSSINYLGQWFQGRATTERIPVRTITQRPSTTTTALLVRISSFGNGTPETDKPINRQTQQSLYSDDSRFASLTRRVANEPFPFGLLISHRTHQLPTSFRPFPTRQNNSAAPPLQRDRFPRSTSVPTPFIAAEEHLPIPPCPSPLRRDPKKLPCSSLRRSRPNHGPPPSRF